MIKALSFDLDDTLWPIAPTIARAEQALQTFLLTETPQLAALCSGPGDVIYFMSGEYNTTCQLNPSNVNRAFQAVRSGTQSNPMTFKPYPGQSPVFTAPFNIGDYGSQWTIIDGLTFRGSGVNIGSQNNVIRNSHAYGRNTTACNDNPAGIYVQNGASNILIENNTVHDNYNPGEGIPPTGGLFNCAGIKLMHFPVNITIIGNTIYNQPAGIHLKYTEGENIIVVNNTLYNNNYAIFAANNNVHFEGNIIRDGTTGIKSGGADGVPLTGGNNVTITRNTFSNIRQVTRLNGGANVTVSNNIFSITNPELCTGTSTGQNGEADCHTYIYNGYYGRC